MKAVLTAVAVLALGAPAADAAQPAFDDVQLVKIGHKQKHQGKGHGKHRGRGDDRDERRAYHEGYREGRRDSRYAYRPGFDHRWNRGQVLPYEHRRYVVRDYYSHGWAPPPPGHAYYRTSTGDILLAAVATGLILAVLAN